MTTPIVVRTGGTGEALTQIGEALGQIRDPNKEQREQFQRFLIQTPGALATLGQQFRDNPAAVQEALPFVPPEILAQIGETPQTSGQQLEDITTESFASLQAEQRELFGVTRILREIGTDPEAFASLSERLDFLNARLKTPEGQALAARGVERRLAGGETAAQRAQGDVAQDIAERAFRLMQELPQEGVDQAALRNQLEEYFFDKDNQLAHAQRLELGGLTGPGAALPGAAERARINAERTESIRQARDSNVSTQEHWSTFLFDETRDSGGRTKNQRGIALALGQIPSENEEDIELQQIASAWLRQGEVRRVGERGSILTSVQRSIDEIEQRDADGNRRLRSTREALIEQLNPLFLMLHNLSKTLENPEGTVPLRRAFIEGAGNGPLRFDDGQGNEIGGGTGESILRRLFGDNPFIGRFFRSPPSARGGEQPQSVIEEERSQTFIQPPTDVPPGTVERLPTLNTINVDASLFQSPEASMANLLLLQSGEFTFKEIMDNAPITAVDILRSLRPEFQNADVQSLTDSLIKSIIDKSGREPGKPEPDAQGVRNQ